MMSSYKRIHFEIVSKLFRSPAYYSHKRALSIMKTAYSRALEAIKNFTVQKFDTPVFLEQSIANGEISDLPLKNRGSQTQAKIFFDIVENIRRDAVNMASLQSCLMENRYDDLPEFIRPKKPLPVPYQVQIAMRYTSARHCTVLKHYICTEKMSVRVLDDYMVVKAYLVDLPPNHKCGHLAVQHILSQISNWLASYWRLEPKAKQPREKKPVNALQSGFDYIRTEGPRTNIGNRQVEWAEIEVNCTDGHLSGWSAGLVKECPRNHANSSVYSKPQTDFYLTLHDIAGWFLDDVLVNILGDLQTKTLVMMGFAEKGKTPVAQAIAMAMSEYHILLNSKEKDMQPSFRLCASLDQPRGESRCVERPDILNDPDTTTLPVSKLKSFLDSTLSEVHTVKRWTTSRFVRNQLRIICGAEPEKCSMSVTMKTFMEMIQLAFPDKASKQDIMACLKRSHWIVNLRHGVYLRPAGTSSDDVMCVSYTEGMDDFISPEGKTVNANMKNGCKTPPSDWTSKRQWSHDYLSMLIEHCRKPSRTKVILEKSPFTDRTTRREIEPSLLFSGRICPD